MLWGLQLTASSSALFSALNFTCIIPNCLGGCCRLHVLMSWFAWSVESTVCSRILGIFCETQLAVVLCNYVSASTLIWANGTPPRYTIRGLDVLGSNSISSQRAMRILWEKMNTTVHQRSQIKPLITNPEQIQNQRFLTRWPPWLTIYKIKPHTQINSSVWSGKEKMGPLSAFPLFCSL